MDGGDNVETTETVGEVRATAILRMPASLKRALIQCSAESSINDVAVGILAAKYGMRYGASGRRSSTPKVPRGDSRIETVILRMPQDLHESLAYDAYTSRQSLNTIAVREIALSFGMTYDPPPRGRRKPRR